jgi:hypothetical protein
MVSAAAAASVGAVKNRAKQEITMTAYILPVLAIKTPRNNL